MEMKKILTVILVLLMLAGCSKKDKPDTTAKQEEKEPVAVKDPFEDICGTWRTSGISLNGVKFTMEQIEVTGEKDSVDFLFIFQQDGGLIGYSAKNGYEGKISWSKGDDNQSVFVGDIELTMEDDELVFPIEEDTIFYLEKISDRQDEGIAEEVLKKEDETVEPIEEAPEEPEPDEKEEVSENTIRPEIKEAIDAYEAFIDEYCEFMTKYAESDGSDLSLLVDYATFMGKLEDYTEKFDALEDDLTDAEYWYYIEVLNRCNEKMLKAMS